MPSRSFILLRLTEETRRKSPLLTMPGNRTGPGPAAPASRSTMRGGPSPAPVHQPHPRAPGFLPAKPLRSRGWVPASGSAHSRAPPSSSFARKRSVMPEFSGRCQPTREGWAPWVARGAERARAAPWLASFSLLAQRSTLGADLGGSPATCRALARS